MSRYPRLGNWPNCLFGMSDEELKRELAHWRYKTQYLGHANARKEAAKMLRDVEKAISARREGSGEIG
jgi:hypothetical protein